MADNIELIEQIVLGAQKHLLPDDQSELRLNEETFLDIATDSWVEIASEQSPTYPTRREIKKFLKEVVHDVTKEVATKHRLGASVTLAFATEQLINYLLLTAGWTFLAPYLIPLEILSAIVYTKALKAIAERL